MEESKKVLGTIRIKTAVEDELNEYSLNINRTRVNKLEILKDVVVPQTLDEYVTILPLVKKLLLCYIIYSVVVLKTIGRVIFLAVSSQMTGFNAVMFYLQTVLESTHTTVRPEISSVIIGCIQVLACLCTIFLTDKSGRKPVLLSSLVGLTIGMLGLGTFFKLRDENYQITGFLNYLPLVSLIIVIFCFNGGMGATIWTLSAELFDGESRAMGVSLTVFVATVFTFLTTRYFGSIISALGPAATYWMFAGCCVISFIFILLFVPETKGKAFSEIQRDMGRKNGANLVEAGQDTNMTKKAASLVPDTTIAKF